MTRRSSRRFCLGAFSSSATEEISVARISNDAVRRVHVPASAGGREQPAQLTIGERLRGGQRPLALAAVGGERLDLEPSRPRPRVLSEDEQKSIAIHGVLRREVLTMKSRRPRNGPVPRGRVGACPVLMRSARAAHRPPLRARSSATMAAIATASPALAATSSALANAVSTASGASRPPARPPSGFDPRIDPPRLSAAGSPRIVSSPAPDPSRSPGKGLR